jgi:DMSO reductase family type II enzyme molybdopterin subunit
MAGSDRPAGRSEALAREVAMEGWSRREFLGASAASVAVLSLSRLTPAAAPTSRALPVAAYGDWRDVYRGKWSWDRVAVGTHTNANCYGNCAWNLFVRDGIVWREEQSAPYRASNDTVPDFNPRGCQKGASFSDMMVGPARLSHPMRRLGPRGSGRWKRISWDEALEEVSVSLVDTLARRGGAGVIAEIGGNIDMGQAMIGTYRFLRQIGAPSTDYVAQLGDLPVGAQITLGVGLTGGSSDDWFRSDYVVNWTFNPAATRIPDAHFLNEARYRGGKVVTIAPDYSQSAIHADLWLSIRPGTDAALALAACQVVLAEGLYDAEYIREQTDLPFLVRADDGRFLREADVVAGGEDDVFAVWDEKADRLAWAPGSPGSSHQSLELPDGLRPALEKDGTALLASGERVRVRTVFSLLQESLRGMGPDEAAEITGITAASIRRFARDFAQANSALILSSLGACKLYHSDLIQRAQILLASLTGNIGRAGGGWRSGAMLRLEGMGLLSALDSVSMLNLLKLRAQAYLAPESLRKSMSPGAVSGTIFHAVHGGLGEKQLAPEYGDPTLPRPPRAYLDEAIAKGHFDTVVPPGEEPPEFVLNIAGNCLRHLRMGDRVRDTLFANASFVVDIGIRMSETSRYADVLLPAAGWYEKTSLKYMPAFAPYIHLGDKAVPPLGDTKSEWEIFWLLAKHVTAEARRRGVDEIAGFQGNPCDISRLEERFTDDGYWAKNAEEDLVRTTLRLSKASKDVTLEDLRREGGAIRVKSADGPGVGSEYSENEPIVPLRNPTEKKQPWNTLTGRQQFYIDHPWFLEVGEALPGHKEPPLAGGDFPFTLTGGHARWSIHSIWRDHDMMLRLQRGEPIVYMNDRDARLRGIEDHDRVRIANDLGSFISHVKTTSAIRPYQLHILHAWEPNQFQGGRSHQMLAPSPIKVTQLVRDYGQLRPGFATYEPNGLDRDTRVDVQRLEEGSA